RAPVVDLVAHLTVVPVESGIDKRESMCIERRPAVRLVVGKSRSAPMTAPAGIDFACLRARRASLRGPRIGNWRPGNAPALVKRDDETLGALGALPVRRLPRPCDVIRSRPVACFARDIELRPCRVKRVVARVVVLPEIRRVTLGALEVPGLAVT